MSFLRSLTLRQLQIFVTVARHASFVRAVEELHLTQPAVSMQVKQLESVVGLPLFERVGRQLTLTEPGDRLQHHASRILGEVKDAEEGLQAVKDIEQGSITIGLISTVCIPIKSASDSEVNPASGSNHIRPAIAGLKAGKGLNRSRVAPRSSARGNSSRSSVFYVEERGNPSHSSTGAEPCLSRRKPSVHYGIA